VQLRRICGGRLLNKKWIAVPPRRPRRVSGAHRPVNVRSEF
jgi:hypothetical protein